MTARSQSSRHGVITAVVCLALAAVVAAMASLNVALPDIARDTHASQTDLTWVIDAYSLAFAALLLPGGGLGDRYGRRMALIVGLLIFGAGSAIAMTATSATELIALRAVLGLGAALVMPATLSTITSTFPASERTRAVSIWAAVGGGAAILGLLAAGALLVAFSWRSIFALNVLLAAVALLGTLRFVPESANPDAPAPRCRRGRHRGRGAGRVCVLGDRGADRRLACHPDASRPDPCACAARHLHLVGAAPGPPAARPARIPQPAPRDGEHVDLRPVLRVLRLHVHRHAVPPAGPRRHAAARRRPSASARGSDGAHIPPRPRAHRALRHPHRSAPAAWHWSPRASRSSPRPAPTRHTR